MVDTILIVEDEPAIREGLVELLQGRGYKVEEASEGTAALSMILERKLDAVLLDVMLPGLDGLQILRKVREAGKLTPIIMLTAQTATKNMVDGLSLGADDYISKPFANAELLARLSALIRRTKRVLLRDEIQVGSVLLDLARKQVTRPGYACKLTPRELEIIRYLYTHRDRSVSRAELLVEVWELPAEGVATRTVENHIARLRAKVEEDASVPVIIQTVRGEGYRFHTQVENE